jgi:hypothetical protein
MLYQITNPDWVVKDSFVKNEAATWPDAFRPGKAVGKRKISGLDGMRHCTIMALIVML